MSNKTVRLSELSYSNDSSEGKYVKQILNSVFDDMNVADSDRKRIAVAVDYLQRNHQGIAFCLSEAPDLLSQWRGYGDDGNGFSIGFSKQYLINLQCSLPRPKTVFDVEMTSFHRERKLMKVVYDTHMQEEIVRGFINNLSERGLLIGEGKMTKDLLEDKWGKELAEHNIDLVKLAIYTMMATTFAVLLDKMYIIKDKNFREEREWRFLSDYKRDDKVLFRGDKDRLLAYEEISLKHDSGEHPIRELYIDPKNITEERTVSHFLEKNGFERVKIIKSSIPYR